ncbi:UDP pyrophosphate phosphatase [Marinobacter sp. SS21]|uniref:UDP pyrophosphate phosphatase n=1 Tax=Marinobacter sp. SS21 TaxID=2979460 RepID=UPI0023300045|nr:UDP pyrophosphate phosphatase [Marinobacter sp. SS21]MDC0662647.1 UDP pyrophosphate phosphatase [Marinobacter sp. SS21]
MISSLNSNASLPLQSGNASARDRADVARNPAASPERSGAEVRQDLAAPRAAPQAETGELAQRRVDARRAAEDVRLEPFRADELPLVASQALSTFAAVAAQQGERETELAGISIRV